MNGNLILKSVVMKRMNKKTMLLLGAGLVIGTGAYLNYRMAQQAQREPISDLTLANIEAMALVDKDHDVSGGVTCEGQGHIWCPLTNTSDYYSVTVIEFPSKN